MLEQEVVCYVSEKGLANLSCPKCGFSKTINLKKLKLTGNTFKATCQCKTLLKGKFEFRGHYRKKVRLAGEYLHKKNKKRGQILVEDISFMGIGFNCMEMHSLQEGDRLEISFRLDNANKSEINLCVEVKRVCGPFIGVQRCDTHLNQPDLGFYLR